MSETQDRLAWMRTNRNNSIRTEPLSPTIYTAPKSHLTIPDRNSLPYLLIQGSPPKLTESKLLIITSRRVFKLAQQPSTPLGLYSNSRTPERRVRRRRNSTSSSAEVSWDNRGAESSNTRITFQPSQILQPHPDAGPSQTVGRIGFVLDTRGPEGLDSIVPGTSISSPANSTQYSSRPRSFLSPVDPDSCGHFPYDEREDETAPRVPKKSASSPVLYVPSLSSTSASTEPISPFHNPSTYHCASSPSGRSPEPPPYTSLPPPLISIPPITPLNGINRMPLAIPVPVPVPLPMSNVGTAVAAAVRHANEAEMKDDGNPGASDGDGMIYTSRNGPRSDGCFAPAPMNTGHSLELGFAGLSSHIPSPRSNSPRLNTFHHTHTHDPRVSYQGTNKPKYSNSTSLRRRIFGVPSGISSVRARQGQEVNGEGDTEGELESEWESEGRTICTTPGMVCAGETETETDEPSRHLPTARAPRTSSGLSNSFSFSNTTAFQALPWQRLLFEFSRLLAIVPASLGFIWCLWHIYTFVPDANRCASPGRPIPDRIDYIVASLWALLTAHQCLSLTTGLLTRWRHYYPPLSTLVRLLALQGICWPATHLTVNILEVAKRPVVVWAIIGTTTCTSRSIQIWVVSNLSTNSASSQGINSGGGADPREREKRRALEAESGKPTSRGYGYIYWKKWNKWRRRRRWDWREVSLKCVLPAGVLYFVMAWSGELRRELGSC